MRGAVSTPKDYALTLRSSRRVPAGRFRPSFHSRPYAPCLHAPLNSNVSAQRMPSGRLQQSMQGRRRKAQCSEFLAGFVVSQAAMTPPSASGGFVETQPLIEGLQKPPGAAITEATPCAHSLESAAPCHCIEKGDPNHMQSHTKEVLVQRSSEYIAIMSFVGRSCLTTAQRFAQAKGLRANPSFEPTRSGRPLQAFISFSALRALPPRAAQLKR